MTCDHGWHDSRDCDSCTIARVAPAAAARITELEAQIAIMRRERDDLRDILAGIGRQASAAAASYRDNLQTR